MFHRKKTIQLNLYVFGLIMSGGGGITNQLINQLVLIPEDDWLTH